MISFKILTEENFDSIANELSAPLSEKERREIYALFSSFDLTDGDSEIAVCLFAGCALVRVFDMGRYFFLFPFEISDGADVKSATLAMREYAMREEIPFVVRDVPTESLYVFFGFRHMDIDAEDEECAAYRVRIKTECELMDEIPHIVGERVELRELLPEDVPLYARLCKDENVNKYWGYDYKEDVFSPGDEYFYENAASEFSRGVAFSVAVCEGGKFIGECTLYAFDGMGAAEFSVRLLPECHGRGFGSEAVGLLCDAARAVGLLRLRAKVSDRNAPSLAMLEGFAEGVALGDGTREYEILLYPEEK